MKRTARTGLVVATLAAALVVALVLTSAAAPAQAAPVGAAMSTSNEWAYGGQRWVNVSVQADHGTYAASAFFGWQVVLTATNTSATTVQLEAQRTLGVSYQAQYCSPACNDPSAEGQLSIVGYEADVAFANLSSTGTVYENGTPAGAIALLNTSGQSLSSLNESLAITLDGSNGTHTASGTLNVSGTSNSAVSFGTAGLGLIPWNVGPGTTWNASGMFNGSGAWTLDYRLAVTGFNGTTHSATANVQGTVNATGSLAVLGTDLGNITLSNGATVPRIAVVILGPFDVVDGVIFVPHGFNIFNSDARPWSASAPGAPSAATAEVDFVIDHAHRAFHIAAAMTNYATESASITAASAVTPSATQSTPSLNGIGSTSVQAEPESITQANAASQCYASGCEVTVVHAASNGPISGVVLAALVGLAVATIVGVVAVLEWRAWSRRRGAETQPPAAATTDYSTLNRGAVGGAALPPPPPQDQAGMPGSGPRLPP